ncbi:MAG: hypothetical protein C4B59_01260 [Candidatus Methanogaster sp.]|uniref:Uncharacterized protein n=1 Tax=Candidatus Methanogaster sp. TaxID=3386292 RepID=A0AC61L639_9EURY|nr:MAG: hypothetical protein C4B59_01260 [ANME-2 cluster archaeon]
MKRSEILELKDYKEINKIELSKELAIIWNGMGILSLFLFGYFFTLVHTSITQNTGNFEGTPVAILIVLSTIVFTMLFHEFIHGLVISMYGGKPKYGTGVAHYILPYLYTTTETIFRRNRFIVILIAPLIVISVLGVISMITFPAIAHWFIIPLTMNAAGAIGDLWMTFSLLRHPEHILLADDHSGLTIYGKITDKVVNTSPKGFISDFFIGFLIVISSLIVLLAPLTIILHDLNVDSFVFGIGNGYFTVFEYSSGEGGFGISMNPLQMLFFSGVMGLIYGLSRSGKPAKPERPINRPV